jgi:predicted nuclease with RNAse H fold
MKLVGLDLSASPRNCGICVLEDNTITHVGLGERNPNYPRTLHEYCVGSDVVAIDAPFGWPKLFTETLTNYRIGSAFDLDREQYRLRRTDIWITRELPQRLVRNARPPNPFSVSTDKLGVTAMVGTVLLNVLANEFHLSPREGGIRPAVIEVYPSASLWAWGLRGYERGVVLDRLQEAFGFNSEDYRATLLNINHCFDALIAVLTASAYAAGETFDPEDTIPEDVLRVEGWIRVPRGSFIE